jgi:hypothetical protein
MQITWSTYVDYIILYHLFLSEGSIAGTQDSFDFRHPSRWRSVVFFSDVDHGISTKTMGAQHRNVADAHGSTSYYNFSSVVTVVGNPSRSPSSCNLFIISVSVI